MSDEEQLETCHFGVAGCRTVFGGPGSALQCFCFKHCEEMFEGERPPEGHEAWTTELAVLECHRRQKGVPITDEGVAVSNWAQRTDAADRAAAEHVAGHLLFSKEEFDGGSSERQQHPATPEVHAAGGSKSRLFAKGYIISMLSALVSFVIAYSRKPKGEEINLWIDHAWSRYWGGAAAFGFVGSGEDEADPDLQLLYFFGDGILPSASNVLPVANWKTPANVRWLTEKATAAQGACMRVLWLVSHVHARASTSP